MIIDLFEDEDTIVSTERLTLRLMKDEDHNWETGKKAIKDFLAKTA